MAEVQIKVEIQDINGNVRKRVTLAVHEDITKSELFTGLKSHFSELLQSEKLEMYIDPPDNRPLFEKYITEGSKVIVRPRQSRSMMRVINVDEDFDSK